ncbi:MAG TPA: SDR family oxidoreductase [Gemmatimonadaceae bacterium]|nr:SDR family oxidoreductase [Gemmatimonadaceae bacterium]
MAGATGYLGRRLVAALKARGYWVRALVRRAEQGAELPEADDVFVGQVTRAGTLRGLADGIDVMYSTIGITRQREGFTYDQVDWGGNRALLDEAERAGVERFVYVSVLHGRRLRRVRLVAAKERFVDALVASPVAHTVIRPTGYFSDMGAFVQMASRGRAYLVGDGRLKMNPIAGEDLAAFCVDAAERGLADADVGGPDVYSHDEIAALAFRAVGAPARIAHIPRWLAGGAVAALRLVTPVSVYGPLEFFYAVMTTEMVAPRRGAHRLGEFFAKEVARGARDAGRGARGALGLGTRESGLGK